MTKKELPKFVEVEILVEIGVTDRGRIITKSHDSEDIHKLKAFEKGHMESYARSCFCDGTSTLGLHWVTAKIPVPKPSKPIKGRVKK